MTLAPVELVWNALDEYDCRPRGRPGKFTALCPAHEDHEPSLTVAEGHDARALVHCFAGCPVEDILDVLGLTWRDLFDGDGEHQRPRGRQLPRRTVTYRPRRRADVVLDGLDAAGIAFRGMWVADGCPACGAQALYVRVGRRGEVTCECAGDCESHAVLDELDAAAQAKYGVARSGGDWWARHPEERD